MLRALHPARGRSWTAAAIMLAAALLTAPSGARADSGRWHGEHFPNVKLKTHEGKTVRFYDDVIRGKVVAINFIYTSCGDVCPLDTAQLREVYKLLGDRVGKDIFMYSISVDPARDTPEVLARYRRSFDVGPGWTFLTGKSEDITLIQKKLGIRPPAKGKLSEHDTRMIFGNEKVGSWVKRSPFDDPNILAGLLGSSLSNYARSPATANLKPYGEAEEIKETSKGAYLYRTRCDTCHTIGKGDKLGPDLRGVAAARAPAWLKRWIKEPDKMLAEKDPVALQLKAKYRNLPMPNLSLSDTDVDAILDYMKQQDERVAKEAAH